MRVTEHSLPYQRELDGLRGIAILLVLLYHLWPGPFSFGYVGVDVFFVLSGYLITKVIATKRAEGRFRLYEFYRNRIRRIFPAMILVLLATILAGYLFLFPDELSQLGTHVESSAFFFQNVRLSRETGYWDQAAQLKPLLHFWSLSIEEQFYAFWPLLIGLLLSRGLMRALGVGLAGLMLAMAFPTTGSADPFFHSFARFWELAVGGATVWLERDPRIGEMLGRVRFLPWILFAAALFLARGAQGFRASTLVLVALATSTWLIRLRRDTDPFLNSRLLVFLGLVSFPLYLWHYPMISYLHIFGIEPRLHAGPILVAATLLAFLTYHYLETFSRRQTSKAYMLLLVALAAGTGAAGRYLASTGGLPHRAHLLQSPEMERQFVRAPYTDPRCEALFSSLLRKERLFDYCRATSSEGSSQFVAIIGDSHAQAAFEGFAGELAKRQIQTVLLANSACPAFVDGSVGRDHHEVETCQRQIDQIYATLDRLSHLQGVILVARGPKYMEGSGFGQVESAERNVSHYRRTLELGPAYPAAGEYIRALESSLRYLTGRGIHTYVLLENPELGFSPKACMARPFGIWPTRCTVRYEEYSQRMRDYRRRVTDLTQAVPGAAILDPEPLFCDRERCSAMIDGRMLYADDDHLSVLGSQRQAQGLVGRIRLDGQPSPREKELARRFEGTKKTAKSVHPGVISTNLTRPMNPAGSVRLRPGRTPAAEERGRGIRDHVLRGRASWSGPRFRTNSSRTAT